VLGWLGPIATAVIAVIVFVAGQYILKFVLEPIQEQRKLRGEVGRALVFYANREAIGVELGTFTKEQIHEASGDLRDLAARLQASLLTVPYYDTLARLRRVLPRKDVRAAATELIGWSNEVLTKRSDTHNRRKVIAQMLDIDRLMDIG
jgi:hypothetical protein